MSAFQSLAGALFTMAGVVRTAVQILGYIAYFYVFTVYYTEVRALGPCLLYLDLERHKLEAKLSILAGQVHGTTEHLDEIDRCVLAMDSRMGRKVTGLEIKTAGSLDVLNGGMEAVVVMLEKVSEGLDARLEEQKKMIEGQAARIDNLCKMVGGQAAKETMQTASEDRQQD